MALPSLSPMRQQAVAKAEPPTFSILSTTGDGLAAVTADAISAPMRNASSRDRPGSITNMLSARWRAHGQASSQGQQGHSSERRAAGTPERQECHPVQLSAGARRTPGQPARVHTCVTVDNLRPPVGVAVHHADGALQRLSARLHNGVCQLRHGHAPCPFDGGCTCAQRWMGKGASRPPPGAKVDGSGPPPHACGWCPIGVRAAALGDAVGHGSAAGAHPRSRRRCSRRSHWR